MKRLFVFFAVLLRLKDRQRGASGTCQKDDAVRGWTRFRSRGEGIRARRCGWMYSEVVCYCLEALARQLQSPSV